MFLNIKENLSLRSVQVAKDNMFMEKSRARISIRIRGDNLFRI